MIFKDDIGVVIQLDTGETVTGASAVAIKYRKPSGTTGTWTGTASTQYIQYTTQAGDIDEAGTWVLQAYVTGLAGFTGHGNFARMNVEEPIS